MVQLADDEARSKIQLLLRELPRIDFLIPPGATPPVTKPKAEQTQEVHPEQSAPSALKKTFVPESQDSMELDDGQDELERLVEKRKKDLEQQYEDVILQCVIIYIFLIELSVYINGNQEKHTA